MNFDLSSLNLSDVDVPPPVVFIVPYRDRVPHKHFFINYMTTTVLADKVNNKDYAIYFVEQKDRRPFNRGAMKNIGFLAFKYRYPLYYKNTTFVFNDVDTVPYKNILDYNTSHGVIKHFYGFTFALGGIFSITGEDFERIGGFPNFWGWGCEDNCINDRAIEHGIHIDRTTFFNIGDMNILQMQDGVTRNICRREAYTHKLNIVTETVFTIKKLKFDVVEFNSSQEGITNIDVEYFETLTDANDVILETQDMRKSNKIDITPILKERFDLNVKNKQSRTLDARAQIQYQQQQQQQQQDQQQQQQYNYQLGRNVPYTVRKFRSMSSLFMMKR